MKKETKQYHLTASLLVVVGLVFMAPVMEAQADTAGDPPKVGSQPSVRSMTWPAYEGAPAETVSITKSTSQVFRFDRPISRTAISNPAICDITPIGAGKDVLINAKDAGIANLIVWDNSNNIATYNLDSTLNLEKLNSVLLGIDPHASLEVVPFNGTVALYGTVGTSVALKQMEQAVKSFDKDALSYVHLKESKEVLLEVRFAEVNRKANKDFKFDYEALGRYFHVLGFTGQTGIQQATALPPGAVAPYAPRGSAATSPLLQVPTGDIVNLYGSYVSRSVLLQSYLKWLETHNVLKIIARPNLVAKDGEEAQFLVGGEFPVPIVTNNNINIDYKQFGTKLKFTPEVLENQTIRLKVETEVSELDFSNTVTLSGIVIPSLIKRNHQTIAELKDNQTFVIGGLITQRVNRIHSKIPLIGDIPLLGLPFNSDTVIRNDVELLVVITPHIVKPIELNENKEFYDAKNVAAALGAFSPDYTDAQGDRINKLITQSEGLKGFDEKAGKESNKEGNKGTLAGGQTV